MLESYPNLNFPDVGVTLIKKEEKIYVYDPIRKKDIILQPEEWVRQHAIQYLIKHKSFPLNLMTEEYSIKYGRLNKRIDLLVYDSTLKPLLLAEFKSYNIELTNDSFLQASVYNHIIKAPYLLISNGIQSHFAAIDFQKKSFSYIEEFPNYTNLVSN